MNDLDLCLEVVQGHVNHCGVNFPKTTWAKDFKFGTRLCTGRTKKSPKSGRGLGHVTLQLWAYDRTLSSKLLS